MAETSFRLLSHCCRDMAKTRRFYEEVLDFKVTRTGHSDNPGTVKLLGLPQPCRVELVFLEKDGLVLELQHFANQPVQPATEFAVTRLGNGFVSLTIKDLPEMMARVPQYGGEVLMDHFTGSAVLIKDPDGQVLNMVDAGVVTILERR